MKLQGVQGFSFNNLRVSKPTTQNSSVTRSTVEMSFGRASIEPGVDLSKAAMAIADLSTNYRAVSFRTLVDRHDCTQEVEQRLAQLAKTHGLRFELAADSSQAGVTNLIIKAQGTKGKTATDSAQFYRADSVTPFKITSNQASPKGDKVDEVIVTPIIKAAKRAINVVSGNMIYFV